MKDHFDLNAGRFGCEIGLYRHDPRLVQCVRDLGEAAGSLIVVHVPGTLYKIEEYDGKENVVTPGYDSEEWTDASKV